MPALFDQPPALALDTPISAEREDAYLFWDDRAVLAVNVALAADRPLLIRGPAGCGKSSLARAVAKAKDWNLLEVTITARTEPRDLLWELDAVARLSDAQAGATLRPIAAYIRPGPLWWAFNASSAEQQRGELAETSPGMAPFPPTRHGKRCVLLLDEIDKADPDLPNALLEALGERRFPVPPLAREVTRQAEPPLVVITTNEYRELSRPFLRRCVQLRLDLPDAARLVEIAQYHFGPDTRGIYEALAVKCLGLRREQVIAAEQRPGPAEYLDAVRACASLGVTPGTPQWDWLVELTMQKPEVE